MHELLREFAVEEFFSYKLRYARKGKIKYRRATYKIRRQVFFVLRVAQVKKAKDFFSRRATYKGAYVEAFESARAGLSPQEGDVRKKKRRRPRKARRWLHEGKVPCALNKEFLFLVHEYLGSERPVSFKLSAPTRLSLRGSHMRRKFQKRTTLRSESSTLILYTG